VTKRRKRSRELGTNPRAKGTNPRALGTNPRALQKGIPEWVNTLLRRLKLLGFPSYDTYLASDHWKDLRKRYAESDLPQTCFCKRAAFQLHHITYRRLGEERLNDLVPVCEEHHRQFHQDFKEITESNPRVSIQQFSYLRLISKFTRKERRKMLAGHAATMTQYAAIFTAIKEIRAQDRALRKHNFCLKKRFCSGRG
jgi:hypothetical protein